MKIKKIAAGLLLLLAVGIVLWQVVSDRHVVNTSYTVESKRVPPEFDGFKIALITDFHNGENGEEVLSCVRNASPDIICIAGDLVSMDTTDYTNTIELAGKLLHIAPVYYAYGNHEYYNATYHGTDTPPIWQKLQDSGVIFLNNELRTLKRGTAKLNLLGYADSIHSDEGDAFWNNAQPFFDSISREIDPNVFAVLLLHRAQYFDRVSEYPFDLVLGGHLHGGEIGLEPFRSYILKKHVFTDRYSKGQYSENGHQLVISAGCTVSDGVRLFNPPEVVSVVLKRTDK